MSVPRTSAPASPSAARHFRSEAGPSIPVADRRHARADRAHPPCPASAVWSSRFWSRAPATCQLPAKFCHCMGRPHRPSPPRPPAGPVAQWLEPTAHNGLVAGSSPAGPTTDAVAEPCPKGGFLDERRAILVSPAAAGSVLDRSGSRARPIRCLAGILASGGRSDADCPSSAEGFDRPGDMGSRQLRVTRNITWHSPGEAGLGGTTRDFVRRGNALRAIRRARGVLIAAQDQMAQNRTAASCQRSENCYNSLRAANELGNDFPVLINRKKLQETLAYQRLPQP